MTRPALFIVVFGLGLALVASGSVDSTSGRSSVVRRDSSAQPPQAKNAAPISDKPCTTNIAFWNAVAAASKTNKAAKSKPSTASKLPSTKRFAEGTNECVDPSTDDPESWACDCSADMESKCDGIDEECFQDLMCEHSGICQEWKDTHCPSLLEMSSKAVLARARKHQSTDGRLDGAMSGKCGSNEVL